MKAARASAVIAVIAVPRDRQVLLEKVQPARRDRRNGPTGPTGPSSTGATGSTGPRGDTGPASSGAPTIAAAVCDGQQVGGGFITQRGFTTFTRNSAGDYSLVLAGTPPPDSNCVPNVTLRTLFSVSIVFRAVVAAGVVRIQFFNTSIGQQGFADADFNVIVTDDR